MRRSSDSGQVEPLAALVAVAAVCAGLTLYAGALADAQPAESETRLAETVADRLATSGGVEALHPESILAYGDHLPADYRANVTLRLPAGSWAAGPEPPEAARQAVRDVSVRTDPAQIRPARLTVVVWS